MNFRNYTRQELDLEPGMVLVQGGNGQGKSNLLEALYMLAIAKSARASADRELIRRQGALEENHAQVSAVAERDGGRVRVQIDLMRKPLTQKAVDQDPDKRDPAGEAVQKYLRLNGVPRRSSELVGEINAVMFSAQDLELVLGPPVVRRRYLDILISQVNTRYLKALQKYQRVVSQRNHLLKRVREGRSRPGELKFWDDELVAEGSYIMAQRSETVLTLSQSAASIHLELTGQGEELELVFRPSVETVVGGTVEQFGQSLRSALELQRDREVAQGFTVCGPHRDDLQMLLEDMDTGMFASRGECRTVTLAMKLAEAGYLRQQRGQEPILLLDDVLSELDAARRALVLDRASQYQQCFITTTDVEPIEEEYLSQMARFVVHGGQVEPVVGGGSGGN